MQTLPQYIKYHLSRGTSLGYKNNFDKWLGSLSSNSEQTQTSQRHITHLGGLTTYMRSSSKLYSSTTSKFPEMPDLVHFSYNYKTANPMEGKP